MASNVSLFGFSVRITADRTFPSGFTVTDWADDMAPIESENLEIAGTGIGPNGHLVVWSRPAIVTFTLSVIPNQEDDRNLMILLESNRVSKGRTAVPIDKITAVLSYPNGMVVTCSSGIITGGPAAPSGTAEARVNSRSFDFAFEEIVESRP